MASPAFERILEIQDAELRIDQLRHRIATHALRRDLAQIDEELAANDAEAGQVEGRKQELLKSQKRLQDEASLVQAKRTEIDGKLYGGEVQASKELLALQDEAAALLARQQGFEDEELEAMEALEEVEAELSRLSTLRQGIEQRRVGVDDELTRAVSDLTSEAEAEAQRRDGLLEGADPALLDRYRSLRTEYDGIAVARVVNGSCEGCNIHLSAVAVDQMSKLADDAVFSCEECGRILVR
jgi:predicted  nucleic acid-binding Zn-ribbon protein